MEKRFEIKAFYPKMVGHRAKRVRRYQPVEDWGDLAIHTWHKTEISRDIEIEAFRQRMKRGEISHILVLDLQNPGNPRTVYL